jgi:hypothetical protein
MGEDNMKPGKDFIGFGCGALIVNDKNQVLLIHRTGTSTGVLVEHGQDLVEQLNLEKN